MINLRTECNSIFLFKKEEEEDEFIIIKAIELDYYEFLHVASYEFLVGMILKFSRLCMLFI